MEKSIKSTLNNDSSYNGEPNEEVAQVQPENHESTEELKLEFSITASCTDAKPEPQLETWQEIRTKLLKQPLEIADLTTEEYAAASEAEKKAAKDGIGIVPVKFKDPAMGRKTENVESVTMIVLDIDDGVTLEEAQRILQGTESVVHTTFSHTPQKPKLRVHIPLRKPVTPLEAKAIFLHMQRLFDGRLDSSCFDVARIFYLPRCPKDAVMNFRSVHVEGVLFDPECFSPNDPPPTAARGEVSRSTRTLAANGPSFTKVEAGRRNSTLATLTGKWLTTGANVDEVLEMALQWNSELDDPMDDTEVVQTVNNIVKTVARRNEARALSEAEAVADMNQQYVFLKDTGQIFRLSDLRVVSPEQMRLTYANRFVVDEGAGRRHTAFDFWLKSLERSELRNVTLAPGKGDVVDGCLNLWEGWAVAPCPGDVNPWRELMDHIFGQDTAERLYFEQWVAYPIQKPGIKLMVASLIWSARQGIGKSLLGETVGKLYGKHSTTITAQELHSSFNDWARSKLFVIGEENSSTDRRADANRLKHLITGTTLYINQKNIAVLEQPNLMNLLFTSNHPDAFHLDVNDRRMFVHGADVMPMPAEFYERYGKWMNSEAGQAALMDHLLHVDLSGFNPHGRAPETAARAEMIDMSRTDVERFLVEATTDEAIDHRGCELVRIDDLVREYNASTSGQRSNSTAFSRALGRHTSYAKRRISSGRGGDRPVLVSLRNHDRWAKASNDEWTAEYEKGVFAKVGRDMEL